jgi:hypothetical protein
MFQKESKSSIAVTFVNNSLTKDAFGSPCAKFALEMESRDPSGAFRAMNAGYRSLSQIAHPVNTKEDAFELIELAFGSIDLFFLMVENQRIALRYYARTIVDKGGKSWFEGSFLLTVCAWAKEWSRKFRQEYDEVANGGTIIPIDDFEN